MYSRSTNPVVKLALALLMLTLSMTSNAGIFNALADLDYNQEVDPSNPTASSATGTAALAFDNDTGLLSITASITGISLADVTFAEGGLAFGAAGPFHIHNAAAGSNGPIVLPFNLASFFSDDGMGGLAISAADIPFDPALLPQLNAGNLYLNLHTLDYGSGEIRGQLAAVPEPSSILLLGGLLALVSLRRRRS